MAMRSDATPLEFPLCSLLLDSMETHLCLLKVVKTNSAAAFVRRYLWPGIKIYAVGPRLFHTPNTKLSTSTGSTPWHWIQRQKKLVKKVDLVQCFRLRGMYPRLVHNMLAEWQRHQQEGYKLIDWQPQFYIAMLVVFHTLWKVKSGHKGLLPKLA